MDKIKLVDIKDMASRKYLQSKLVISETKIKGDELRKFAEMVINERIKFCQEYKKDEPFDKCICESIARYLRLFRESHTKTISKEKLDMIEVVFEEMKKSGKIKCQ